MLCELQAVVVAAAPEAAAACVHGLTARSRPVLVGGRARAVLPTQLHVLLEAPVPFLVGAPRTEGARSLESSVPRPGLLTSSTRTAARSRTTPTTRTSSELPEAEAVESAIEDMVRACSGDDRAGRHGCRVVGRHTSPRPRRREALRGVDVREDAARDLRARARAASRWNSPNLAKREVGDAARAAVATSARAWATPSTRALP